MGTITNARAWANNEVAYVAWDVDGKIDGCLGFDVTRVYLNDDGTIRLKSDGSEDRTRCATWVAFKGQRNPRWLPQDTSVWPVQKMSWRDLTLRKKRDGMERRPDEVFVRYEIRPVGKAAPGLDEVLPTGKEMQSVVVKDANGKPVLDASGKRQYETVRAYEGPVKKLAWLGDAVSTGAVRVTRRRGPFQSTFTNGILAAQWLRNVLNEDGVMKKNELYDKLITPDDPHRNYLAGDVLPLLKELLGRKGRFYLSLYELEDQQLENLLLANASRMHVILSNTGVSKAGEWDERNAEARQRLVDAGVDIQHRMFNNATHIGHNKFVVHVPPTGGVKSVLTGSTNWTSTGIAGQTNNALLIEDNAVADAFLAYWKRLKKDELTLPDPLGDPMKDNQPGADLRSANAEANRVTMPNGTELTVWFSPNRPERRKPTSKTKPTPVPPDLEEVYRLMRSAKEAILFLAFYPGMAGKDCIVGEAISIGQKDSSLLVSGAVSSAQAMPNYVAKKKDEDGEVIEDGDSPATYNNDTGNVSIVRASNIDDRTILGDFGMEQLTARGGIGAIIHDKLVVIDPNSDECVVVLGSHNLGYKASYSNDENMVIVRGNRELAMAYAVHVLDVTDHYRFRAIEKELKSKGKKGWSGFLQTDDTWQDGYVSGKKGAVSRYFARP